MFSAIGHAYHSDGRVHMTPERNLVESDSLYNRKEIPGTALIHKVDDTLFKITGLLRSLSYKARLNDVHSHHGQR